MISVVLVEPENAGNIGAVARVMANFDCAKLVLIKSKVNHLSKESLDRAVHAKQILHNASIYSSIEILRKFDYVIGTASDSATYNNISRSPVHPDECAKKLATSSKKTSIAIVFGRETTGLTNKEISLCDYLVTIPTSKKYPSMNLSHAVAVVLYELFKVNGTENITSHFLPASEKEKKVILSLLESAMKKMDFASDSRRNTQILVFKRLIGKSMLSKKEAFALCGFFRKIKQK